MLSHDIRRYVELQRATGLKFHKQACLLAHFASFAAARGEEFVRTATVLEWAGGAPSAAQRDVRLRAVRRFASMMQAEKPQHEVPPAAAFGRQRLQRRKPFIFTRDDIRRLIMAAATLGPPGSLRSATYVTLFALLSSTGMRISEALALQLDDLAPAGLMVRAGKFGKSRLIPLHETVRDGLDCYLTRRGRLGGLDRALFVTLRGTALHYPTVIAVFLSLVRGIGLHPGPGRRGPRLHDLRHTFAVRSLEQCAAERSAVERHVLALSTYLGHAKLADTYWYLEATPTLLADVAQTCETFYAGGAR